MDPVRASRFHRLRKASLLFLPALLLRLYFNLVLHRPGDFIYSDMRGYEESAKRLLAGTSGPMDTFTPCGYPAFLAGIYAIAGHSHRAVAIVQALLGAGVCVLGWRLAARVLRSEQRALAIGIGCIFYVPYIYYGGLLSTEALATFLVTLTATTLVEAEGARRPSLWLCLSGVSLGALTLVRPNAILAYPVLGIYLWLRAPRPLALRHIATVFALAAPFPIFASVRNSLLLGHVAGIATNGGVNFFLAHTAQMGVTFAQNGSAQLVVPIRNGMRYRAEGVWNSPVPLYQEGYFYRLGLSAMAKHPWEFVRAFDNVREGVGAGAQSYWPSWNARTTRVAGLVLSFFSRAFLSLAFIPAVIRVGMLVRRKALKEHAGLFLMAGLACSSLATLYLYLGDPRVRVPFDLAFWILAVDAAASAARAAKRISPN